MDFFWCYPLNLDICHTRVNVLVYCSAKLDVNRLNGENSTALFTAFPDRLQLAMGYFYINPLIYFLLEEAVYAPAREVMC